MSLLYWDKPEPVMSKDDWKANQADGAPPGTYVPNMSEADKQRWKAVYIGKQSADPRVEIRKTFYWSQGLIVVRLDDNEFPTIQMSFNGKCMMDFVTFMNLGVAVNEAAYVLRRGALPTE